MILYLITILFFSFAIQAQSQSSCIPNPCRNGGILHYNEYRNPKIYCQCPSSYRGAVCQTPNLGNPCVPSPCGGRGTCIPIGSSEFACRCYFGYTGRLCSNPPPPRCRFGICDHEP